MTWFAYQYHPGGVIPVTFAEDPRHHHGSNTLVTGSVVELPPELAGASLAEIVRALNKPLPEDSEYPYL